MTFLNRKWSTTIRVLRVYLRLSLLHFDLNLAPICIGHQINNKNAHAVLSTHTDICTEEAVLTHALQLWTFLDITQEGSLGELKSVWNAISKDIKQSLAPYYKVSVKSECADLCWCENKAGNTPMY